MANRTANYAAFYVAEPFDESNLGANATPGFLYLGAASRIAGERSNLVG